MPGFAGFDRSEYPGDAVMAWLKANTNLVWCGYYLGPAPSHGGTSWMTTRAKLQAAGWGIAPIYVGQQVIGPGSHNSSSATGVADGNDAVSLMAAEGFAPGSCVYLDLENGPPFTDPQRDYVGSWCDAVESGGYQPGVYCSHSFAIDVHNLRPNSRIWAFKVATTASHPVPAPYPDPNPIGSGYAGAFIWQLGQNCIISVPPANGSKLDVDLDSAVVQDPGVPG